MPADFGKNELVWTLTANGKTRTTIGYLKSDWEITPDGGAAGTTTTKEARSNKAPTIDVLPISYARVGAAPHSRRQRPMTGCRCRGRR